MFADAEEKRGRIYSKGTLPNIALWRDASKLCIWNGIIKICQERVQQASNPQLSDFIAFLRHG